MSRIRTIKPEWLEDEGLHEAGMPARILSVALILLADDYGNGRANVRALASRVFWNEENPLALAERALSSLVDLGFVALYTVRGQRYYCICNWQKHQRVDRPGKPRAPDPGESSGAENLNHSAPSRDPRVTHATDLDLDPDRDLERERARETSPRSTATFADPLQELPNRIRLLRFAVRLWVHFMRQVSNQPRFDETLIDGRQSHRIRDVADWAAALANIEAKGQPIDAWQEVAAAALVGSIRVYTEEVRANPTMTLHPGFWFQKRNNWTRGAA